MKTKGRRHPASPLPLPPWQRRLAGSLYRVALLAYPQAFRARFGADLCGLFLDLLADARVRRGRRGLLAAAVNGLSDIAIEGPRERFHDIRRARRRTASAPPGGHLMLEDLFRDLQHTLRTWRNAPGYAAAAVLTLALGIGANSAIFSVSGAALLQSAPVSEPENLVAVWTTCRAGAPRCSSSYPDYLDYRDRSTQLDDLAAYGFERAGLGDAAGARLITVQAASGNYFDVLGIDGDLGRVFGTEDERLRRTVVVLSHELWRDQFGADPTIVGTTIRLNRASFEVIGVTPAGFDGLELGGGPDVFIPLLSGPALASGFVGDESRFEERGSRWIGQLVGRLATGATLDGVRAEMLAISDQLAVEDPDARGPRSITVESARRLLLPSGDDGRLAGFVVILGGIVAFTLLLACANLANLLLARASARRREISVRLAIGASKARLARQMLTESVALSLLGGVAGLLVGTWVLSLLGGYQLPGGIAVDALGAGIDGRVLLFTLAVSVLTGLAFGFVPALQASRTDLDASLKSAGRGATGAWNRVRGGLVAVQLALCLVLLTGSGLFIQALFNGLDVDLGFAADGVAVASLDLSLLHYGDAEGRAFIDTLTERLESMPGVTAAGVGTRAPMLPGGTATLLQAVEGYPLADDEELRLEYAFVSEGYMRALGLPVVEGRAFTAADATADATAERVLIINRDMAERWWPGRSAVGGRVQFFSRDAEVFGTVLGVTTNTKWDDGIAVDDYPFAFMPLERSGGGWVEGTIVVVVRTSTDAAAMLPILRTEIVALEPDASIITLATADALLADVLHPQRLGAQLLSWFAGLALVLAALGIYSVVAYTVNQRRRDLGIRIALGADRAGIAKLVIGGILGPISLGLAAGIAAAIMLSSTLAGFLYGISPSDPATLVTVGVGLALIAVLASLVPARRATRVDPIIALRND